MRRVVITGAAAALLAAFAALMAWQVTWWQVHGWAGLAFQPDQAALDVPATTPLAPKVEPGAVIAVSPASPAWQSGIREGDRVVSVQGVALDDIAGLRRAADTARTGDAIVYEVERGDVLTRHTLRLVSPFRVPALVATAASTVLVAVAFLFIALLVAWQRPRSEAALVFFVLSGATGAFFLLFAVVELRFPDLRGFLPLGTDLAFAGLLFGSLLVSLVIIALLLHLSLIFPRERPLIRKWPEVRAWLHLGPFLPTLAAAAAIGGAVLARAVPRSVAVAVPFACALALALRLGGRWRRSGLARALASSPWSCAGLVLATAVGIGPLLRHLPEGWAYLAGIVFALLTFAIFAVVTLAYSLITCVALAQSYRESLGEERLQLRWPLWGTLISVAGGLALMAAIVVLHLLPITPPVSTFTLSQIGSALSKLLYLLIPVSFAVAIFRYRLFALDAVIRKTIVYSAVTGAVLVTYAALATLLGLALVRSARIADQTAAALATLAALAVGLPVRSRVQRFVDARFFARDRRRDATLRRIAAAAARADDDQALVEGVAAEISHALDVRHLVVLVGPAKDVSAAVGFAGPPEAALAELGADPEALAAFSEIPIPAGSASGGSILVGPRRDREALDDGDREFLRDVAARLGAARDGLAGRRAEAEFAQAREIQRALLPARLPSVPGVHLAAHWQPAREVGGDYYDAFELAPGRLALCIGDVAGKGVPAALVMSSLRAALRAVAGADASPAQICEQVRGVVNGNLVRGRFVTFFFAVLDTATRTLTYANAGHNPPLLARADGSLLRLADGGPAMTRVLETLPYAEARVPLRSGDRLVLFTDGVTEAAGPDGGVFGEERLTAAITAEGTDAIGLVEAIRGAVLEFSGGETSDDLTLLAAVFGNSGKP